MDPWDVEHRPDGWRHFYYAMADCIGIVNTLSSRDIEKGGKDRFERLKSGRAPRMPKSVREQLA